MGEGGGTMGSPFLFGLARQFWIDVQTLFWRRGRGGPSLSNRALALDRLAGSLFLVCMAAAAIWLTNQALSFRQPHRALLSEIAKAEAAFRDEGTEVPRNVSVPEMRTLQRRLKTLGYDPGAIDGRAGPSTLHALNQYRASKLLKPVSSVDHTTAADLLD